MGWARRTDSRRPSVRTVIRPSRSSSSSTAGRRLASSWPRPTGWHRPAGPAPCAAGSSSAEPRLDQLPQPVGARSGPSRYHTPSRRTSSPAARAPRTSSRRASMLPRPACHSWPPRPRRAGLRARCAATCPRPAGPARRGRPGRPLVPPPADHGLGHRLAGDHGGDAEQRLGGQQPVDQPERPVVEPVGVVEQQDRHPALAGGCQHGAGGLEQPGERPAVMRVTGPEVASTSVGIRWTTGPNGISRSRGRRPPAAGAVRPPPQLEALLAEPGLADPRRPVDAHALAPRIVQRPRERVQLVPSADERPPRRHGHQGERTGTAPRVPGGPARR